MKFPDMTGALIGGGKSRRFGSDKRLFVYRGKRLLDISFEKLDKICRQTICVFRDPPPSSLKHYPRIYDDFEIEGPLAGLIAALEFSKTPFVFILPCDVPDISLDFLMYLASLRSPGKIIVPYTWQLEPLIGIYPASIYAEMKKFAREKSYSLRDYIFSLGDDRKRIVRAGGGFSGFKNFNRVLSAADLAL